MEDDNLDSLTRVKKVADKFLDCMRCSSSSDVVEDAINCSKECEDYPMIKKGLCYIFNQKVFDINTKRNERSGTDVDADLLETFFKAIKFDVSRFDDSDLDTFLYNIQEVSRKDFKEYSCFVCCILSYEEEPNVVYAKDGTFPTKRVFEKFYANKCISLKGKPKIFFIQACNDFKPTLQRKRHQSADKEFEDEYDINTVADFLVVYSTVPGFYSWENAEKGSWFIEALCQTLQRQIANMDLLQLLKIVNRKVLYDFQTHFGYEEMKLKITVPCVTSTLIRNIKIPVPSSLDFKFLNSDSVFSFESENYALNCTRQGIFKGKVFIFNHENFIDDRQRLATNKDADYLEEFFKKPDFDVQTFPDLAKEDILKEITNVASISHEDFGCFICCILTHGEEGTLTARDNCYEINEIFSPFYDKWVGKPKIFFIQACRGDLLNSGVRIRCKQSSDSGDTSKDYNFMQFTHPDFLIAYSTVPGEVSMRNRKNGSWFIQTLCSTLIKNCKKMNLQQLLTIVHREVAIKFKSNSDVKKLNNKKQVPCLTSTLTKNVKF